MVRYAKPKEEKEKKVTFFSKESIQCPVCETLFKREELFQGRVNAGDLTDELHRLYTPMAAFGEVQPLVYELTVCPSCYYSAFKSDFLPGALKCKDVLEAEAEKRIKASQTLFPALDFQNFRRIDEGAASYFLAMMCYEHMNKDFSPTAKQAMCAIRAAWLFEILNTKFPKQNFDAVMLMFYKKALFLYKLAMEYEQKKVESISAVKYLGPDTDKNYGYEGVIYLCGLLEYKYGQTENQEARTLELDRGMRGIARMFGLGKKSKNKPGPLLEKGRLMYETLKKELKQEEDPEV